MSEPTELLRLAELLYDAFRDSGGLRWMPPFGEISLVRRENWMRVARIARENRWRAFSEDELRELNDAGFFLQKTEAELIRSANRWSGFETEDIQYLSDCIDATGDPYQHEVAHDIGAELTRRVAAKQEREA